MARDALKVLLRLRALALDTARRELAERMAAEANAVARADALRDAVRNETASHAVQPAEAWLSEAYAVWLGRTRLAQQAAVESVRRSVGVTADARAAVREAQVEVRTLEAMLEQQAAQRRATAAQAEQAALDEAGRVRKPPADKGEDGWSG